LREQLYCRPITGNGALIVAPVGKRVCKAFDGVNYFGLIYMISNETWYHVVFEDGYVEDWDNNELMRGLRLAEINASECSFSEIQ
jgi:hypothetical protein